MSETTVVYRGDLADRLGIALDRLHLEIRQEGQLVLFEILVDGKDLTPEQERIALAFIAEHDGMQAVFIADKIANKA